MRNNPRRWHEPPQSLIRIFYHQLTRAKKGIKKSSEISGIKKWSANPLSSEAPHLHGPARHPPDSRGWSRWWPGGFPKERNSEMKLPEIMVFWWKLLDYYIIYIYIIYIYHIYMLNQVLLDLLEIYGVFTWFKPHLANVAPMLFQLHAQTWEIYMETLQIRGWYFGGVWLGPRGRPFGPPSPITQFQARPKFGPICKGICGRLIQLLLASLPAFPWALLGGYRMCLGC